MLNMNKPLSIFMITHHRRYRTAGRSQVIAQHLVKRGHHVTLLATADERRFGVRESQWDGIRVIEAPDLLWGKLRSGWDLWSLVNRYLSLNKEEKKYDLIHCFETRPGTIHPAMYYARKHNLPLFSDWNDWFGRGGIIDVLRPKWYRLFFGGMETYYEEAFRPRCVGTTVISRALANRAERLGINRGRICYLSGGVIPGKYVNHSLAECRAHLSLSPNAPLLGFASADSHLDMNQIFASLAIIAKKFPAVKLIVTGKMNSKVIDSAKEYGVAENILPTGFLPIDEFSWWLGAADVLLLPFPDTIYNIGRWPNKVGIYMSLERPIVTNPVGDVKSLVENHQVGLLAEEDPVDYSNKIIHLLKNPELARQLGRNGRKAALTNYNWETLIGRLEEFYSHILDMEKTPQTWRRA
jgi:glycosyltransferase involved in cell wall biosynthesis